MDTPYDTPTPNPPPAAVAANRDDSSSNSLRRALARKYSTRGPPQSTTISQVAYSVAIPIEYPQEKALLPPLPLNKCPTRIHPETKSVGESKEINRLHAQPAKSHPTNVPPTLQSAYYLLLIAPTDTTQKEEQNNSYTKRVGKRYQLPPTTLCYNVPSARTRADQHK